VKLFLAHVMTYVMLSDIATTLHYFSEADFESVLNVHHPVFSTAGHGHTGTSAIIANRF